MALTPEARREIVEEAKRRALKDMGKPVSELARQSEKNAINYPSFIIGGKMYAVGYFDSKGNRLGTAYEYNGDYGVMVYWRNENGKAERKFIPFNPFRERLESETSENWNREYVDYNGKVLRDAVLMDREQGNTFYSNKKEAEENAGAVARREPSLPSYISSADSEQSENFSENQEKNAKHSKSFDEEVEIDSPIVESEQEAENVFDKQAEKEAREIKEVKAKWTNRDGSMKEGYMKAPNGQPTKLAENLWLLVRTPSFIKKYGDWETLARINEIENLPAEQINKIENSYKDKKSIEALFEKFGEATNKKSGNKVLFSKETIGKIIKHKSEVHISEIAHEFKKLFEKSILFLEEPEIKKEGHKQHSNFKGYEHYVNKFAYNGKEYYIRFTVPVENAKPQTLKNGYIPRKVHSSYISDISIYEKSPQNDTSKTLGMNGSSLFVDEKLADFLNSVNEKDVKIPLDRNGEPIINEIGIPQVKSKSSLVFKPILRPSVPLPKRFRDGKVAGIGEIRRWVSEAMGINVNLEADAGAEYAGVYTTPKDTINLRKDHINSLRVLFHELGHSIEKRFFNNYFSSNPNSVVSRELFDYFKKQKNAKAYAKKDYIGEGFAEFIKEFVLNPGSAAKEFQRGLH